MTLSWAQLLDALEEQTRRAALALRDTGEPASITALEADGPIPPDLVERVQLLLSRTQELEHLVLAQRSRTQAALAYGGHPAG